MCSSWRKSPLSLIHLIWVQRFYLWVSLTLAKAYSILILDRRNLCRAMMVMRSLLWCFTFGLRWRFVKILIQKYVWRRYVRPLTLSLTMHLICTGFVASGSCFCWRREALKDACQAPDFAPDRAPDMRCFLVVHALKAVFWGSWFWCMSGAWCRTWPCAWHALGHDL